MDNGIEGVIVLLFSNGGSALVKPINEGFPTILLPREKLTRIPVEPKQPR